ncbi:MAG: DNA polymerase III subunit delta' [Lysobacter sp.]|nr:DNA polymerase III subunit delta' [Lysobacter sp.]
MSGANVSTNAIVKSDDFAPWQRAAYAHATAALDADRLGHGLLICGPAKLGKRAVAQHLARRILCTQRDAQSEPCGRCRSCQLFAAGTHPDFAVTTLEPNKEGTKLRTEIVIEQIRGLSERMALTPQYGGAQIALLDPADAINHAACNALLKTLEEPHPGRYLWLICAQPARLPATIRSRCQRLEFRLPPVEEAMQWLRSRGHAETAAREALDAARGHPGLADDWLREGGLAVRREVAEDLAALARGARSPVETAQRWAGGDDLDQRLRHAADLALIEAARCGGSAPDGLTSARRIRTLATWFDAANRTRDLLRTTVRADLAVVELLAQWRGASSTSTGKPASTAQHPRDHT